jgi:peptide chain release factor subunit 1
VAILVAEKSAHFLGCQLATSKSVKQHKLRKRIAWLSGKEAKDKEFLSLYIPSGASISQVVDTVKNAPDCNIAVADRVEAVLKHLLQYLKQKSEIPANGMAIFAGTLTVNLFEGGRLNIEEITPPLPITAYLFEVNNHFQLQPLREMLRDQKTVGILALDAKDASFGLLAGDQVELIDSISSGVPGKTVKGGQSQRRYERERDMELTAYFHRVAEHGAKAFLDDHQVTVLLVGGPGSTKNDFLKGDFLNYQLSNVLLNTVDTQSIDKTALREILCKSDELLKSMCEPEEKKIVQRLLSELAKPIGLAIYGFDPVLKALSSGEVDVALVTDDTGIVELAVVCKRCGTARTSFVDEKKIQSLHGQLFRPCTKCNGMDFEVIERDIVDVLEDFASQTNSRVEVISSASEEKAKLATLGAFAALLRYRQ